MRIGVSDFPPFLFAGIRQVVAGILLFSVLTIFYRIKIPSGMLVARQALAGFLMITLGNGLVTWGEVYVPSGLAAIICSFMPVWVTLINLTINRSERPNGLIITGVLTGLAGIILVFSEHLVEFAVANYQLGIFFIFVASLGWAIGSIVIKRSSEKSNLFMNVAFQMFFGGLLCFVFSFVFDDLRMIRWQTSTFLSLGYLIVVGSALAFAMYGYVLSKLPITIAALYSYVNPLVAVVLGWVILDEKFNLKIGLAIVITVLGIYMVNKGYQLKNRKETRIQ